MDSVWLVIFVAILSGSGGALLTTFINNHYESKRQHITRVFQARLEAYSKVNWESLLKMDVHSQYETVRQLQRVILVGSKRTSIYAYNYLMAKVPNNNKKNLVFKEEWNRVFGLLVESMRADISNPNLNFEKIDLDTKEKLYKVEYYDDIE